MILRTILHHLQGSIHASGMNSHKNQKTAAPREHMPKAETPDASTCTAFENLAFFGHFIAHFRNSIFSCRSIFS
jgi:hypothetical protein